MIIEKSCSRYKRNECGEKVFDCIECGEETTNGSKICDGCETVNDPSFTSYVHINFDKESKSDEITY